MSPDPRTYRFDPLDHSGVLFGLSAGGCVALGAALGLGVLALTAGAPLPLAVLAPLAAAVVVVPIPGGGPLWSRLPSPRAWWRTRPPRNAWFGPIGKDFEWGHLPACLGGLSADGVSVVDRHRRTRTVALRVFGPRLSLRAPSDQDLALALWGDVLAQLGADPDVVSLAWSDYVRGAHRGGEAADDIESVVESSAARHEAILSLSVRDVPGASPPIERVTSAAYRALAAAGIAAEPALGTEDLERLLGQRADPFARRPIGPPLALRGEWASCRIDGTCHRSYWIASWPQLPVRAGWLDTFLGVTGVTRTFTVAYVPVARARARRQIERDLVKLESEAATRLERGRRVDARHQRVTQSVLDREQELVEGHAEFSYVGLVTVSAPDDAALAADADSVEQLALETGVELRPLYGRHDLGWAASLPFGLLPQLVDS